MRSLSLPSDIQDPVAIEESVFKLSVSLVGQLDGYGVFGGRTHKYSRIR